MDGIAFQRFRFRCGTVVTLMARVMSLNFSNDLLPERDKGGYNDE
jgi:hypothetical protein